MSQHHDAGGIILLIAVLIAFIARSKGRSFLGWLILGAIFNVVALIAVWFMPAKKLVAKRALPEVDGQKVVACGSADKKKAPNGHEARALIESFPQAKTIHVIDGDTVIVTKGLAKIRIRLDSIDCPEDDQHWGDIAAYGLIKLVGGRNVRLEEHGIDCHGRTLATIYVQCASGEDWTNVNERMVTLGHAWVMRRYYDHLPEDRQAKLNDLENWARSKKVGLWRIQDPIPPWQWRNDSR